MLAIHLILYTIEEYYRVTVDNTILCSNKGVLYTFKTKSKRIRAGTKRNNTWRKMKSIHLLHHVRAHHDDNKRRKDPP